MHAGIVVSNFEELTFQNGSDFNNGSSNPGPFTSGPDSQNLVTFNNSYSIINYLGDIYESWYGFSSSRVQDGTTDGFRNQYAAYPGSGSGLSSNYLIAYADGFANKPSGGAYFNLPTGATAVSVDLANTTYVARYIKDGKSFPFTSLPYGSDDYFDVILTGYDGVNAGGSVTGSTKLRLADYTNGQSLVLNNWTNVDLTPLNSGGRALSIGISFDTTDFSVDFGINTPTYVALDNLSFDSPLSAVPEPSSLLLASAMPTFYFIRRWMRKRRSDDPSAQELESA